MSEYTAKQRRQDYGLVFGSEEGKRVLADLIRAHNVLSPSYTPGKPTEDAIFAEGGRNAVLRILTYMNMTPEDFEPLASEITYPNTGE